MIDGSNLFCSPSLAGTICAMCRSPLNGWNYMCRPPELAGIICAPFCHFFATFVPLVRICLNYLCSSTWLAGIYCAVHPDWLELRVQFVLIFTWIICAVRPNRLNYLCSSSWYAGFICAVCPAWLVLFVQFILIGWNYMCSSSWFSWIICAVRPDCLNYLCSSSWYAGFICAFRPDWLVLFVQFVLIGWNYLCSSTWLAGIISLVRPDRLELFVQLFLIGPICWHNRNPSAWLSLYSRCWMALLSMAIFVHQFCQLVLFVSQNGTGGGLEG